MRVATRWRIAAFLFVGGAVNYLDRAAISIASPAIRTEFGLDAAQMGLVFSGFFVGYALFNVVGGWAADRFGPRRVLAAAIVAWSFACAATALAQGFLSLFVLRLMFGAAEGPFGAAGAKFVARWFPKAEVARAIAAIASGTPIGALVAGPVVGIAVVGFGWRAALVAVGAAGLLLAVAWLRYAPEAPPADAAASDETTATAPDVSVGPLLRHPFIVANALAYFAYTWLLAVYLSWLPSYFASTLHLDLGRAAVGSAAPWVMAFVGLWAGGLMTDAMYRRTGRLLASRIVVQVAGLAIAGFGTALMSGASSPMAAIAVASVALMGLYVSGTSFWAVVQDVVPPRAVGRVSGVTHMVANVGGIVGPAVTGSLVQRTDSFGFAFLLGGGIAVAAAVGMAATARLAAPETTTPGASGRRPGPAYRTPP